MEQQQGREKNGTFAAKWRSRPKVTYLPFVPDLNAIARLADIQENPEQFIKRVVEIAQQLAEAR
jgi:hypothetical protein